ncbi:hypothetical protein BTA51_13560 [Hahella sp. CCB-MM4]|uniref:hypothetical protein n=1 Tax=Hahella sp. (strain CCB-MM4) TaxID=1926491 RepID=UPI000B9ADEDA|nr:hypothetical protein [Hahella sp. CCB-MM4]OZG72978.1 hypothetical protein BTA51_13560 [Hahella sp. CCB-MM4]
MTNTKIASLESFLTEMRTFLKHASHLSPCFIRFIKEESLTMEDARQEWTRLPESLNLSQREKLFTQAIEHLQTSTWKKAKGRFNDTELDVLAKWMKLETQALSIVVDRVECKTTKLPTTPASLRTQ